MTYESLVDLLHEGPGFHGQCPACECGRIEMNPVMDPTGWKVTCSVCPQIDGFALLEGRVMCASLDYGIVI